MSRPNAKKIRKKIGQLEKSRRHILSTLLKEIAMLRGSYALVYTKCGRENCHCRNGPGHSHPRITWREKGQGVTRKIPPDQIQWIQRVTEQYRKFRSMRRELPQIDAECKKLLDEYEDYLVEWTREGKAYLEVQKQNRNRKSQRTTKRRVSRKRDVT